MPGTLTLLSNSMIPLFIGCAGGLKRHRKNRAEGSETGSLSARCILGQSLIYSEPAVAVRKAGWVAGRHHRKTYAPISGQQLVSLRWS